MRKTVFLFVCLLSILGSNLKAQDLSQHFKDYEIIEYDHKAQFLSLNERNKFKTIEVKLPEIGSVSLDLTPRQLTTDSFKKRVTNNGGEIVSNELHVYPYYGQVSGYNDSNVGLTISENYFQATIRIGKDKYTIQQLKKFDETADQNQLVVYRPEDGLEKHPANCGADHIHQHVANKINKKDIRSLRLDGLCFEVEIALASDFEMFQDYGSANNVEDQIVGVLNDVQTNYDDEFPDNIFFEISEMFIVTSEADDPWTNSTNAGTLLGDFRNWGQSGGFGGGFDVASLWTDRDFNGGTVGIAYLSAVCGSFRYNCNQDFTGNANSLRVLQAHELGHNFGSNHDNSGGFIMSPSVNNTDEWSTNSINVIDNFVNGIGCLDECTPIGNPPTAEFDFDQDQECPEVTVEFFDESTGDVEDYFWEFEGGFPETSTDPNPVVTYFEGGSFDVTLTVSNDFGDDVLELNNVIQVADGVIADFDYNILPPGNIVEFIDQSDGNIDDWSWSFDDGNFSSEQNPTHTFTSDGEYFVELEVSNVDCVDEIGFFIEIETPPTAGFSADITEGCAPLTVQFTNESSDNTDDTFWEFEGGNPSFSSDENPEVVYEFPGTYSVLLAVENGVGSDELFEEMFITVLPNAIADFDADIDGQTVTFTNFSEDADEFEWDFGDGNTSDEEDPVHTYDSDGTYTVTLTAIGVCGPETATLVIEITSEANAVINTSVSSGCVPLTVVFDGTDSNLADDYFWEFEGGTPSTSTDPSVTVVFNQIGEYNVALTVSNSFSEDTEVIENAVFVNDAPTANFIPTQDGNNFTFEVIEDGTFNNEYNWDFGDGNAGIGLTPSHTYEEEGIYTVTLTATNECGSSTSVQEFNLFTVPISDFDANIREGCADLTVQFSSEASPNSNTFEWTFEGGSPSTSTEENPVVVYETAGIYRVSLMVSNPAGSDAFTQDNFIVVDDVPEVDFSVVQDQTTVSFVNQSSNGDSFEWDFGDGTTSITESPVHEYPSEGDYVVTLTATNECGTSIASQTISVTLKPTANFAVNNNEGCAPLSVSFIDNSSSNVEAWAWEFPGGTPAASTDQNPVIDYASPGTYSVRLIVAGSQGMDTLDLDDIVIAFGPPETTLLSSVNGNEVMFVSGNQDGTAYFWDFGDGNTSDQLDPTHMYAENGTYQVSLTITNECGSTTVNSEITINAFVVADFSADTQSGCPPFEVTFTQTSLNSDQYLWSFDGADPATSTEAVVTVTYNEAGTYPVSLVASNELGDDEIVRMDFITVGELPTAAFDAVVDDQGNLTVQNTSSNGDSFSWNFGDGGNSSAENPTYQYTESGTYTVELTVSNACGSETISREITVDVPSVPVGPAVISDIEVRPNPNFGDFWLYIQLTGAGDFDYNLYSTNGQFIDSGVINAVETQTEYFLNMGVDLPQGSYIIEVISNEERFVEKIVVVQ